MVFFRLRKRGFNPFVASQRFLHPVGVSLSNHDRIKSINNQFARTNPSTSSGRTAYLIRVFLKRVTFLSKNAPKASFLNAGLLSLSVSFRQTHNFNPGSFVRKQ